MVAYFSICRPIMEYSSIIWSPHLKKYKDLLESINRKAFRWTFSLSWRSSISALMTRDGWETLETRRVQADIKFANKILNETVAVPQSCLLRAPTSFNTRNGALQGSFNSNTKKHFFFNRINKHI